MSNQILIIALIVVGVGIICGAFIVLLIALQRRQKVVDSLISQSNLVGLFATVEIPFEQTSRGKVRLTIKGSMVDLVAVTDEEKSFQKGDRVLVVEARNNKVWVVSEDSLNKAN
jgi:acyl-CoA hydrolase